MKKLYLLGLLALITSSTTFGQTDAIQNKITTEDKLVEVTAICLDAIEAPTKYNEFVKPYLSLPNFPQNSESISREKLSADIKSYLALHPELLDEIRAERKKAHDKLYGPRPF